MPRRGNRVRADPRGRRRAAAGRVLVEGRERFRIVEETEGRSYRTAEVEPLEDSAGEEPSDEEAERTLEAFRRLAAIAEADEVDIPSLGGGTPLSFQLASRVDFGTVLKQELLELRSERARLDRLVDLLAQAAGALAREREVRERASGNGKVTRD
jgi:Lon protease-like protein